MAEVTIDTTQQEPVSIGAVGGGTLPTFDAPPTWSVSSPSGTVVVTPSAEGVTSMVVSGAVAEDALVTASALFGGRALSASGTVHINPAIQLVFGTPVPKP